MTTTMTIKTHFTYHDQAVLMSLHPDDHISKVVAKGAFYEQEMLEYIASLKPRGTIIDVGANIGNHTVFFGLFTVCEQVVAIEPYHPNFELLMLNITDNHLQNKVGAGDGFVRAFHCAAGFARSKVSMQNHDPHNMGNTSVIDGEDIDVRRLDDIIPVGDRVSVIKIDVQGWEPQVLAGATRLLSQYHPTLFIEAETPQALESLHEVLHPFGYTRGRCFNWTPTHEYK